MSAACFLSCCISQRLMKNRSLNLDMQVWERYQVGVCLFDWLVGLGFFLLLLLFVCCGFGFVALFVCLFFCLSSSLIYSWANRGMEKLTDLLNDTQQDSDGFRMTFWDWLYLKCRFPAQSYSIRKYILNNNNNKNISGNLLAHLKL